MKRGISLILLLLMLVSPGAAAPAAADAAGPRCSDWAAEACLKADARHYGILCHRLENADLTLPVSRSEFCDMLYRVVNFAGRVQMDIDLGLSQPFIDTDRHSVYCLAQLAIVRGVGGESFDPDGSLTREQAAVLLSRAAETMAFTGRESSPTPFTDAADISVWAVEAVADMQRWGLMLGTETGAFAPRQKLTREQAAVILVRFFERNGFNHDFLIRSGDGGLTLPDLDGLNGKYRSLGNDTAELSFYRWQNAVVVVTVEDDRIVRATCRFLHSGKEADLLRVSMADVSPDDSGRVFLGSGSYSLQGDGVTSLERDGQLLLTLPWACGSALRCQKLNGREVAYLQEADARRTVFFSVADGRRLFAVDGVVSRLTNRFIITETYGYHSPTVDAACTLYGVCLLDGTVVEPPLLSWDALYALGYLDD